MIFTIYNFPGNIQHKNDVKYNVLVTFPSQQRHQWQCIFRSKSATADGRLYVDNHVPLHVDIEHGLHGDDGAHRGRHSG